MRGNDCGDWIYPDSTGLCRGSKNPTDLPISLIRVDVGSIRELRAEFERFSAVT